jgi:holo-ACP synthase CitX
LTLEYLRRQLLEARDARAAGIARLAAALPPGHALVFLSLNVPGPHKDSPQLDSVFRKAGARGREAGRLSALASREEPALRRASEGRDALGPWAAFGVAGEPAEIKRRCVSLEEAMVAGRLVDLDVFDRQGLAVDRRALGLAPRRCLVCGEAAVDCIRVRRHAPEDLDAAVERLLHVNACADLAEALVHGARIELELTPKPGLVDRADHGSHPDLSFELMSRSIDLLPVYYEDLLQQVSVGLGQSPGDEALAACIGAGKRAEQRMLDTVGSNAHRGYIFLSGLVLLGFAAAGPGAWASAGSVGQASTPSVGQASRLSSAIASVARRINALQRGEGATHGAGARRRHGVGGILGEALSGLPSVFDHALPALERAEARLGVTAAARHVAMASLMTVLEDTTALHRCGAQGLERLRTDGRRILEAIEGGGDDVALLERLNDEYRAAGLTMGGVADCLAVTIGWRLFTRG